MADVSGLSMPEPESDDLGRYLEDTITIDWQTPAVMEKSRALLDGAARLEERVERLFCFVRDEISHSADVETEARTCRASEVLERAAAHDGQRPFLRAFRTPRDGGVDEADAPVGEGRREAAGGRG